MIDSNQDEAVKLEEVQAALRAIAEGYPAHGEEDRYVVVENPDFAPDNGNDPRLVIDTHAPWSTRTLPPANLNAPDKQEALAGEGVYLRARELEPTDFEVTKVALAILAADKDDLLAGDGYPEGAAEAFARAALMAAAPAIAGDDRNGVEGLVERLRAVLSPAVYERCAGGWRGTNAVYRNPDGPEAADMLERLSRTPSPQADEADVER